MALEATRMAARYDEMLAEIEEAALDLEALQGKPVDPRDTLAVSSIVWPNNNLAPEPGLFLFYDFIS